MNVAEKCELQRKGTKSLVPRGPWAGRGARPSCETSGRPRNGVTHECVASPDLHRCLKSGPASRQSAGQGQRPGRDWWGHGARLRRRGDCGIVPGQGSDRGGGTSRSYRGAWAAGQCHFLRPGGVGGGAGRQVWGELIVVPSPLISEFPARALVQR